MRFHGRNGFPSFLTGNPDRLSAKSGLTPSPSLQLVRAFFEEGLLDQRTFLVWVTQQMESSNLAQASFVLRLADEYSSELFTSRAFARPVADALLSKYTEVHALSLSGRYLILFPDSGHLSSGDSF
jgi:hypothetical protein